MKYITLTRGNSEIWYPMYELKSEYITNGYNSPFVLTTNAGIHGRVLAGRVGSGGTLNVPIEDTFNDTIPKKATDFGSIMQTDCLYEQDPDLPTTPFSHLMRVDGDYYKVPIGEKPDDWDTNYFDYCTKDWLNTYYIWQYPVRVGSSSIDDIPSWDAETQYYKNNTNDLRKRFTHFFKTGAGYTFGMWTGNGTGDYGIRRHYSRCATDPGQTIGADSANKFWWRDPDGNGVTITGWTNSSQVNFFGALNVMDLNPLTPTGETSYSNSLEEDRRDFFTFIYTEYEETPFYGLMAFGINSQGTITDARGIIFEKELWGEDSISDEKPEYEYEVEEGPVTPSRTGGQGTFTSMSNNDGDRSGTSLLSAISTANATFKNVLGDAFNIYEVGASDLSKVINVLYGSEYFTRFENTMFNPLSAIISCALLPEIFVTSLAPLHDMLAGGYNISDHIWPNPVKFKSPEPLIVRHIGDISLNKYFDGYADFDPYTKAKLHLPYIGEIAIDINKIAHGEIAVEYVCDVLSGNVAAWVWCNDIDGNHQYCYTATGNCAYNIPLFSATADGSAIGKIIGGVASISVGNILGGAMSVADGAAGVVSRHTQVTGTYSGNVGQVTNPKCFLEISRPQWVNVDDENDKPYKRGEGLPAVMKGTIKSNALKNHLSVSWVDLTNIIAATQEELAEIESMLKSGILINEE